MLNIKNKDTTEEPLKVGYVYDPFMTRHNDPKNPHHEESPNRILAIYNEMINRGLIQKMINIRSREVTSEELLQVHSDKYLTKLYKIFQRERTDNAVNSYMGQFNSVYANLQSLKCAEIAAGSTTALVTSMINNEIDRGVAIVRPPGHHGCKDEANGFCFFNNIGIAAMAAKNRGLKVAIVDFDVHHGQASQELVTGKKDMYYISVHRYDGGTFFPGTGSISKEPNVLNIPLNSGGVEGTDKFYEEIFTEQVVPTLDRIKPDILLVSAGFDAGEYDPLGGFNVTPKGFRRLVELMIPTCSKIALVLEGGYNISTLSKSMAECTEQLFIR
jgi:acetoin utilization deacetylase AcuC-like enzyme